MSLGEHLLTMTATITDRAQARDESGALVRDAFGVVQLVDATRTVGCWFEALGSDEAPPIAEQTGDCFLPPGDPVTSTSRLTINGDTFEIVGPPARPINPRTREAGLVRVALKRTTG